MSKPEAMHGTSATVTALVAIAASALVVVRVASACEFEIVAADRPRLTGGSAYDVFSSAGLSDSARVEIRRAREIEGPGGGNNALDGLADSQGGLALPNVGDDPAGATPASDAEPCDALVTIATIGPAELRRGGSTLLYRLQTIEPRAVATRDGIRYRVTGLEPGERAVVGYSLTVPPDQFVPSGLYDGELVVSVDSVSTARPMNDTLGDTALTGADDRRTVTLAAEVEEAVRIAFAGTQGRRRVVDFGELRTGGRPTVPVSLLVQATSPYLLSFRSDNAGQLRSDAGGRDWSVPYELRVNDRPVDLDGGTSAVPIDAATDAAGRQLPLDFRIVDASERRAGRYTDRLTVEITPRAGMP